MAKRNKTRPSTFSSSKSLLLFDFIWSSSLSRMTAYFDLWLSNLAQNAVYFDPGPSALKKVLGSKGHSLLNGPCTLDLILPTQFFEHLVVTCFLKWLPMFTFVCYIVNVILSLYLRQCYPRSWLFVVFVWLLKNGPKAKNNSRDKCTYAVLHLYHFYEKNENVKSPFNFELGGRPCYWIYVWIFYRTSSSNGTSFKNSKNWQNHE